jgi:hypothetical protein
MLFHGSEASLLLVTGSQFSKLKINFLMELALNPAGVAEDVAMVESEFEIFKLGFCE